MARKSKVETSPHYNEIVDLLVAGYSPRYVSDYLKNEYNEKISYVTLHKYKKDNLNVKAAVRKKIIEQEKEKSQARANEAAEEGINKEVQKEIQAQESFEIAADYRYKDIKKLDDLIGQAESINIDLDIYPGDEKYDPYKEQNLRIKMKKLGLEAIKLKYELIDEDDLEVNINDNRVIGLAESIEKSRQEYLQEKEKQ
jgi:hypothetical protein